jgi:colicin import membrane protein
VFSSKDRPRTPQPIAGRRLAFGLAVAVHVLFIAVLVFSIRWQNRRPDAVTVELYAPPVAKPVVEAPVVPPPPVPTPAPEPAPAPPPPAPLPPAVRKPEPVVEKPDPRAADIALKAKAEAERKRREEAEREKREAEKKQQDEQKRVAEAREAEALKAQAARERAAREAEALKAQANRERQAREAEALKAQAARETREREQRQANDRASKDYIARITAKIKSNINEPGDIPGNPEAVFRVVQLPTGEIIEVTLVKSSGLRAYDDAVERAIRKSSPLPKPAQAELWIRALELRVHPRD